MRKLIQSSVSPRQIGEIVLKEILKQQENVDIEKTPMKNVTFEVNVSFSCTRNPIASIILNGGD